MQGQEKMMLGSFFEIGIREMREAPAVTSNLSLLPYLEAT